MMFGIKKSLTNRKLFGVLGGIAERFNIDANILRIIYLVGCFISFGELVVCYLLLAVILPTNYNQTTMRRKRTIRDAKKVQ